MSGSEVVVFALRVLAVIGGLVVAGVIAGAGLAVLVRRRALFEESQEARRRGPHR